MHLTYLDSSRNIVRWLGSPGPGVPRHRRFHGQVLRRRFQWNLRIKSALLSALDLLSELRGPRGTMPRNLLF